MCESVSDGESAETGELVALAEHSSSLRRGAAAAAAPREAETAFAQLQLARRHSPKGSGSPWSGQETGVQLREFSQGPSALSGGCNIWLRCRQSAVNSKGS